MHLFADRVADRLLELHAECGGGDILDPETWVRVAERLGCRVSGKSDPHGIPGTYIPSGSFRVAGAIGYNTALARATQAHVLVHESAHHLLYPHEQGELFAADVEQRYDDNPDNVQHVIARLVEVRIFGRRSSSGRDD